MELSPGHLLRDRYKIKGLLGKGGMGAVYLAEDTALDQLVAVKSNLNPGEHGTRQFETEARLLAKLRHPNLPLVFDHFIIEDIQYLVMDFIPGENLNSHLKDEGAQAVYRVLEWAEQITSALTYLHSQDPPVIHRDIKPANLKVTPEGKIVLVDFGIAKVSTGDTTVGAQGYTPGYAPPEQYSDAVTGPYSDQYSFAATIYALLTGSPPPESVDIMLGESTLPSTRFYIKNIPTHVDHAIQRAMSPEPAQRFANVKQFFTALTDPAALADPTLMPGTNTIDSLSEEPTIAKPAQGSPAQPRKREGPWLWIGTLAVAAVVVGGGILLASILGNGGIASPAASPTQAAPMVIATNTPPQLPTAENTPTDAPALENTPEPTATLTPSPEPTPLGGGGKIIFVSNRDGYDQIYEMNVDGSNLVQLTFDETHKSWPMYSPDGTKIIYVGDGGLGPYNSKLGPDIWVMDTDGGNQTNLTQSKGVDEDPVWSPDSGKIVFVSRRYGGTRQLMSMNADGSEQARVSFDFEEYNPTFSPDSTALLFSSTFWFTLNIRENPSSNLDTLLSVGLEPRLYDDRFNEPDRVGKAIEPAWSPDGNWIVFIRTSGNNRRVYLLDANSEGATVRHLEAPGLNFDPAWSPDSQYIVYTSKTTGNLEIFTMDLGGRFQTNLTNFEGDDKMPCWKPVP